MMKLQAPFEISARLLPSVHIGESFISITFDGETPDGRARYRYYLDTPTFDYENNDLASGVGGGSLQAGMESLLSFLGAAAEAYRYGMRGGSKSENADLFPEHVMEWAYLNEDELGVRACEMEGRTA